ncbi:uncharacterized protein [Macaca nemestrina]|uniref:uncharacterized protein n=1 Tax=Macaca nemestrina TaxID=9545 RepID=UPI0039B868DF
MTCILTGVVTETKPRPSSWASVDLEAWVGLSPSPCSVARDAPCLPSFTVPRLTCLESTCCCFVYSPAFAPLPPANLSPLTFFPTRNTCQWNTSGVCVEFLEDLQVDRKSQCVPCGLPSRWLCLSLSLPPLSRNTHTKGLTFYPKHFLRYFPHTMTFPFLRGIGVIKGVNVPLSPVTVGLRPCEHLGQSYPGSLGRCKLLQRRGRLVLPCCVLRWSFSGGLGVPPKAQ